MKEQKKKKSEITKSYIYETAIRLFEQRSFEKTTMRDLSKEVDMSLGNIYYHFKNKDDILIHYFKTLHVETVESVAPVLESQLSSSEKVKKIIEVNFNLLKKNSGITKNLIKSTASLGHPLSPFGLELRECQEGAIDLFRKALVNDEKESIYYDSLAFLYWLYYLSLCLCWSNDSSENYSKTESLYSLTFPLTTKLVGVTKIGIGKKLLVQVSDSLKSILFS